MGIMACRAMYLEYIMNGWLQTKVPLVCFDQFAQFIPFSKVADDIGIYIMIPKLATFFSRDIAQMIPLFFSTLYYASFGLALLGFFLLYQNWAQRCVALLNSLLLWRFTYKYLACDVYIA